MADWSSLMLAGLRLAQSQVQPKDLSHWETRAKQIFEGWQNTSDVFPTRHFVFILMGVAALLLGLWVYQWYKHRPAGPTPGRFFYQLTRRLNLGLADQWLVVRIAHQQKLPSPLTLLLARSTFEAHLQGYCASIQPIRRPWVENRGKRIIQQLFGSPQQAMQDVQRALESAEFNLVDPDDLVEAGLGAADLEADIRTSSAGRAATSSL